MLANCPVCRTAAAATCGCPLRHQSCEAGHHWFRDARTGLTRIVRARGECLTPPAPRYDPAKFVRAVFRDAAGRVVDAILAELDARGLLAEATAVTEKPVRDEVADLVVRVLRGLRPRRRRVEAAAVQPEGAGDGRPE